MVARYRHGLSAQIDAENLDPSRTGGITLEKALVGQRLEVLGDSLGALDTEPFPDFADGRLVRVRTQILHHEVEDLPLDFAERLDPATCGRNFVPCDGAGTDQLRTPGVR